MPNMSLPLPYVPEILNYTFPTISDYNAISRPINDTSNYLSIVHMNLRSLRYKLPDLIELLNEFISKQTIIILCEIWLKDNETDYYNIAGYTGYFACRNESNGGGLAMFIQNNIPHKIISKWNTQYYSLWAEISDYSWGGKVYVGGYYRPPQCNINSFLDSFDRDLNYCKGGNILIAGDFNIDATKLEDSKFLQYKLVYMTHGLFLCNNFPTRTSNSCESIIDHYLTNITGKIVIATIDNTLSDHSLVLAQTHFNVPKKLTKKIHKHIDNDLLLKKVSDCICKKKWPVTSNCNELIEYLQHNLKLAILESTVYKTFNVRKYSSSWITPELRNKCNYRDTLYRKFKCKKNNIFLKDTIRLLNNEIKTLKRTCLRIYYESIFNECQNNPKKIWQNINKVLCRDKTKYCTIDSILNTDGNLVTHHSTIANVFCDFFTNVGVNLSRQIQPLLNSDINQMNTMQSSQASIFLLPVDNLEVIDIINALKSNTSAGFDGITTEIVKKCTLAITPLLVQAANCMLIGKLYPDVLKVARLTPVFKKGDHFNASNYRPISVLPVINKVFEKIIYKRLYTFYELHKFFYHEQYGFRANSDTTTAAIDLVCKIQNSLDRGKFCAAIFIDLCKAFDTVDHGILLQKLEASGIRGQSLKLMDSYLTNRYQYVKIEDSISSKQQISIGVPQGSVLGPLLFLVYINDIGKLKLHGEIKLYADDTTLFYKDQDNVELTHKYMQEDLNVLSTYFRLNKLTVNADKTMCILFRSPRLKLLFCKTLVINGKEIKYATSVKFLGLIMDENLKWDKHAEHVLHKILPAVGVLKRLRYQGIPVSVRKIVYYSLIHSHLQYLCSVWGSASKTILMPLQVAQNSAIKSVFSLPRLYSTVPLYTSCKILPIKGLYIVNIIVFIFKMQFKNKQMLPVTKRTHSYSTKSSDNLFRQHIKTNYGKMALNFQGYKLFNSVPKALRICKNIPTFIKRIKELTLESLSSWDSILPSSDIPTLCNPLVT